MTYEQLDRALAFVAAQTSLHEVLITGGEPVLDRQRLQYLLAGLRRLDHIGPVRVACRSLVTCPTLVDRELIALLRDHQDLRTGRPIEVVMHCNHVDELSTETVDRLVQLREAGLHVCNQTVLLRQVNLDATAMLALLRRLRDHGVESYHLYFAGPVLGMDHMRPTLQQALELKAELRARATGRINPHLIVTTRVGKVELGVDGWVVEREADQRHVWIRTPHTLEIFQQIDPTFRLPDECRLDHDGRIVARYLDGPLHG